SRTTRARRAHRRARNHRSSGGRSAISGGRAWRCGRTGRAVCGAARRSAGAADGLAHHAGEPASALAVFAALGIDVERIDELAEDTEPRFDDPLARRLERAALALGIVTDPTVGAEPGLIEDRGHGED